MSGTPKAVEEALQKRDIEELQDTVIEGFKGIHARQDITNGRITTNEKGLAALEFKFRYNRIIWYLFTVAVGLVVALSSYIVMR
jgi:hypothetical protein